MTVKRLFLVSNFRITTIVLHLALTLYLAAFQLDASEVIESWYSEVSKYEYGSEPQTTGAGHFTQVVWKDSQNLGVGKAR